VLVALYDGKPVPKVIDFGVAKAVGQPLTDKTLVTGFGNIVGTLEYMSPEQAEFNQLDIDTRSDIYSLGVLLYELLAGSPPFTRKDLEKAGMLEMLRVIREKEPSKPSNKLSTADGLPTLAANRGTEPANLTKLVRGELDWIVMKALEKDRNRRYETANGFAMDVQRYLADEAVLACPPSAGYRLQKFVRRNRVALVTAAFIGLTLLLGALISTWQAIRATHAEGLVAKHLEDERKARRDADIQRKAAEAARNQALVNLQKAHDAVKQFLTQAGSVDLAHVPQMEAVRRELLEKALLFYQGLLKEEQGPDADIRFKTADAYLLVGKIHMTLGQHGLGAESLGKAHGMLTKLVDESPGVAVYRFRLAWNHYHLGGCRDAEVRTADSEKEYGRAVELMKELVRQHPSVDYYPRHQVEFQMAQAGSAQRLGRDDQARQLREEAMAMAEKTKIDAGGRMWDIMGRALSAMGNELWAKGERIEAEKVYRRALKFQEQAVSVLPQAPGRHHGLASMRMKMGLLLKDVEQLDEAERLFRASVAAYSELTANFPSTTKYRAGLGESSVYLLVNLTSQKRFKEAEEVYRGSLPRAEKLVADAPGQGFHWTVLVNHHREYGLMLVKAGRLKDAEMAYQQGLVVAEKMRAKFPVDRSALERMISLHRRLASVFRETGRRAEAEAASRKADELEASLKLK
jgi:tetratricopeptide (TPR) repeat protein